MKRKLISLTFDDGPSNGITNQILNVLEQYKAKASFFLIGEQICPETEHLIHRALSLGCSIQNHTFTHPFLTKLTDEQIKAEVEETTKRIVSVTGIEPMYFRPPYIDVEDRLYDLIPYTFISGYGCEDWVPEVSAEERAARIIAQAKDGAIILVHDMKGNQGTVDAIKIVIPTLQAEGYEFVNVRQIFEAKEKAVDHKVLYSEF